MALADSPWSPGARPRWVRAANTLGRAFRSIDLVLPHLDEDTLLAFASRRTGLSDFGEQSFREPLFIFLRALEREARLNPVGRYLVSHEVSTLLENRLEIEETYRREPTIADQTIESPIFVTGTGRSGTSILHELLAQDPAHRALLTWEALRPCPPPETASYETDPRIRQADREVRRWERIAPIYKTMHENGARVPQECIYLTAHEFASDLLSGNYHVPSYSTWLAGTNLRPAYRMHRRILKLLQWRHRHERWVLKAPSHLWALDPLFAVYPDARIVQTHRDPAAVIASMTSLMATLKWLRSDHVDPAELGQQAVRSIGYMLKRAMSFRDAGRFGPERFCDVRYADFLADPIKTVAGIYDHFDLPFSGEAERRMRDYLAAKPKGRHGSHQYRFEDTGLDLAEVRERFAPYLERYGIPSEL